MMYFIESVTTYSTSGKTRKGAILQSVAKNYEHRVLCDGNALSAMVTSLKLLVDVVNTTCKGKPLKLDHSADAGWICVKPESRFNDNHVFSIQYAPVCGHFYASNIRADIYDTLKQQDNELAKAFIMEAYKSKKGGEE